MAKMNTLKSNSIYNLEIQKSKWLKNMLLFLQKCTDVKVCYWFHDTENSYQYNINALLILNNHHTTPKLTAILEFYLHSDCSIRVLVECFSSPLQP